MPCILTLPIGAEPVVRPDSGHVGALTDMGRMSRLGRRSRSAPEESQSCEQGEGHDLCDGWSRPGAACKGAPRVWGVKLRAAAPGLQTCGARQPSTRGTVDPDIADGAAVIGIGDVQMPRRILQDRGVGELSVRP